MARRDGFSMILLVIYPVLSDPYVCSNHPLDGR
jgi:hypothetical protein